MRTTRARSRLEGWLPDALAQFLRRRSAELSGAALVALVVMLTLALLTWSVLDPSWNHATRGPTRNLLGPLGAVSADLLMQLFGLAALAFLLPLLSWGFRLLRAGDLPRWGWRILLWLMGALSACAVASQLPRTDRWPLPTGLGGAVGDGLLGLMKSAIGLIAPALSVMAVFIYAGVAILALTACVGFGFDATDEENADPRAKTRFDEDDESDSEPGFAITLLGAIAHGFMALKAKATRALRRLTDGEEPSPAMPQGFARQADRHDPFVVHPEDQRPVRRIVTMPQGEKSADGHVPPVIERGSMSLEGRYRGSALRPKDAAAPMPAHDAQEDEQDDVIEAVALRPMGQSVGGRVQAGANQIKAGKRQLREAQPSLLDDSQGYDLPSLAILAEPKRSLVQTISEDALEQNARLLESVLEDFGVRGEIVNVRPGPVVTLYELEPAPGTKSSRVISLADDIARSMSAISARVAVIPGRNAIGIELPNQKRDTVFLRELLASQDFEASKSKLALCLGKTIGGEPVIADLARMPHLLVAGTTGSGKSVAINTMILSLLYRHRPEECRLIMVDPKMLELSIYDGIPHLLTPVVTDPKKAVVALKWAVREMEERYKKMAKLGVRNIDGFNARVAEAAAKGEVIAREVQTGFDKHTGEPIYEREDMDLAALPYIVVIVDEMADLMMVAGKEIEGTIQRLAQMARAAGIHVVLATQRPSVDVITGTIKANFPTRISFQVTSKIDSRTILGEMGAEQLLGQGDMLYMAGGGRIMRVHGPFVSDAEVEQVVNHLKTQGRPDYLDDVTAEDDQAVAGAEDDGAVFDKGAFGEPGGDLYDQAVAVVLRDKKASTSYIQRRLQIGYNRAASLMERMENEGIVGPANHAGKREILIEDGN